MDPLSQLKLGNAEQAGASTFHLDLPKCVPSLHQCHAPTGQAWWNIHTQDFPCLNCVLHPYLNVNVSTGQVGWNINMFSPTLIVLRTYLCVNLSSGQVGWKLHTFSPNLTVLSPYLSVNLSVLQVGWHSHITFSPALTVLCPYLNVNVTTRQGGRNCHTQHLIPP